jgi:hypothetical protein
VYENVAIVMTVRGSGGTVIVRTIERATQFIGNIPRVNVRGQMVERFVRIAKPF